LILASYNRRILVFSDLPQGEPAGVRPPVVVEDHEAVIRVHETGETGPEPVYRALAIGASTVGRRSIASQVQMCVRCSGLVRQHMCSPSVVHGISSVQR
jgi:hypothetical protein